MIISHKWVLFPFPFIYHEYNNKTSKDSCLLVYYSLVMTYFRSKHVTIPLYDKLIYNKTASHWTCMKNNSNPSTQTPTCILIHLSILKHFKCLWTLLKNHNIVGRRKIINLVVVLHNCAFLLMEKIGKVENKREYQSMGVNINVCTRVGEQRQKSHTPLKSHKLGIGIKLTSSTFWMRARAWSMATGRMRVLSLNGIHKFATLFCQY